MRMSQMHLPETPAGDHVTRTDDGPRLADWPQHIAILNDYVRVPYANGSSYASQFLYREFSRRGHDVTVVGPRDPAARDWELPRRHLSLPSVPLRTHPGVFVPFPTRAALRSAAEQRFDIMLGQTGSELMELGVWLRATQRVPLLCVNTIHLPSVYNVLIPDQLNGNALVHSIFDKGLIPFVERTSADVYNRSDGLIVLSAGLKDYWRERGVRVPIHVIPRSVEPKIFSAPAGEDPFPAQARRGLRLLVVCRHTREKGVQRLLEIFARLIAPAAPDATLTLVGDGPDHDAFRASVEQLGIADRTFFPGEQALTQIPTWYRYADLFVYTSLSETYGQVVSEALWCGLPVVAFADGMGVSQQITHGNDGVLVEPGPDERTANWRFAKEVLTLLRHPFRLRAMAECAVRDTRQRCSPGRAVARYYEAFDHAREHCAAQSDQHDGLRRALPLARWAGIHGIVAAMGCVRRPAETRDRGKPPVWDVPLGDELARNSEPPPCSVPDSGEDTLSQENAG
jgi:1,2-diacylglycerol 3-alpha-glucosyltransferase